MRAIDFAALQSLRHQLRKAGLSANEFIDQQRHNTDPLELAVAAFDYFCDGPDFKAGVFVFYYFCRELLQIPTDQDERFIKDLRTLMEQGANSNSVRQLLESQFP